MLNGRRVLVVAVVVLADPSAVQAQSVPINLQVDVQPTAMFGAGNVTRVSYVIANESRSTDRLFEFAVRSPVRVWRLEVPASPMGHYLGATREGSADVASWGWLNGMPRPGESSPVLAYEAIGLPGIVAYRALRYFGVRQVQPSEADEPLELGFDKAGAEYVVGKTVGVVSLPVDTRPAALANRLRRLVDQACEMAWVNAPAVCRSLRTNAKPSRRSLRIFHSELVAGRGAAISEAAFALLGPNVEYLLTKM
jgi:hypothetical protein